jgi:uncharacterized iron-regulated membrane protein
VKQKTYKGWYQVHKWTSLVCTVFILMLCITGLPLIFHHEIDHWLGYSTEVPAIDHAGPDADVDAVVADALARRPGDTVQFLVADAHEPDALYVRMGTTVKSADMSAFFTYDARTGDFLGDYPLGQGIMNLMLRLHVDLFAGLPGTLFLGFMGVLLLASLVSGAVVYGPHAAKAGFGQVRRQRSRRLRWLDLHNVLGIVTLVWLFVVTATGVVNTLSIPIFADWQANELAEMTAGYRDRPPPEETADLDAVLAAARGAAPDKQLSFLAFPGNEFASSHHFTAFMTGTTALTSKLLRPVLIDAKTGKAVETGSLPWTVSALLLSQPLHFGDYGGMPMKILWALLDIIAIIVLSTGLVLWFKRGEAPARVRAPEVGAAREPYGSQ